MSYAFRLCLRCSINPATIQCIDCQEKMCYSCDLKVHQKLKQHKTDIIPYSQMKQIKSNSLIINGINEHSNVSEELQQELNELEIAIETKKSFLIEQEQKWSTQISSLEQQYEKKLRQFEKDIESNENQFKNYYSSGNTTKMIDDIKKQMETQKQQAWKELNDQKSKLLEKEILLKDMIQTEQQCAQQIKQKEKFMNEVKDLLLKQQTEKDIIIEENQKIMQQLESIKELCKNNLPELGINIDFLDKFTKVNQINNNIQEDAKENDQDKNQEDDQDIEEVQNNKQVNNNE